MNGKDEKILRILKENARASCKEISRKTGLPITTVHNRIKKLEESGVTRGYEAVIDAAQMGYTIMAFVLVKTHYKGEDFSQKKILEKVVSVKGVEYAHAITGEADILLRVHARDIPDLNRITEDIGSIDGILRTATMVVLETQGHTFQV